MNYDPLTYGTADMTAVLKDKEGEWSMVFQWTEDGNTVLVVCIDTSGKNANACFEVSDSNGCWRFRPEERWQNMPIERARTIWSILIASGWSRPVWNVASAVKTPSVHASA